MTITTSGDLDSGWDDKYRKQVEGEAWSEKSQPWVIDFLQDLPNPSVVGDLGAGDGRNSKEAQKLGHQVIMLDISSAALKLASDRFDSVENNRPLSVIGPLEEMPIMDDQLDAAICMDALPQVKNLERAFLDIHRVLKPKGRCLLNVFTKEDCAWGEGERVGPTAFVFKGCYFNFFGKGDIPELCAGLFNIVRTERVAWDDPPHVPFRPYPHRHDAFFYILEKP